MTKKELEVQHEMYKIFSTDWVYFIRSYMGGRFYRKGDYLLRHAFESETNYKRRKEIAYYYNYCAPIVDIFVSHLYKKAPDRDYGNLKNDKLFNMFLDDADLTGNSYPQFIREVSRYAAIYGHVFVLVDKPAFETRTVADQIVNDIRPYFSVITPENVLDWKYVRKANGRRVLDMIKIRVSTKPDQYMIWTREIWEVWEIPITKSGSVSTRSKLIDSGVHDLGEVPIRVVYNKNSVIDDIGLSDIQDIADVNKNIYYLCSDAKEIIENTAFPMLALPIDETGSAGEGEAELEVGTKNIVDFDGSLPGKPFWLESPNSSLAEIRKWIAQDITEIFRLAKMAGMKTTETSVQPWSGVAMEVQNQQLMAALQEKADNMEQSEKAILSLWAIWEGKKFDGDIKYPTDYAIRDMTIEFQNAITALSAGVHSDIYTKELEKKIVKSTLPKISEDKKEEIYGEIDKAIIEPVERGVQGVQNNLTTNVGGVESETGGTTGG